MRRLVDFRSKKSKAKAGICRAVFNILRVNRAGCHGCAGLTSASSRSTGTARRRGRRAAASTASTASTGCATSFHKIFPTRAYSAEAMMRTHTTSKRPIIFVAHSLGGIVVKSVLNHSDAARRGALKEHRAIKLLTYGILFLGTPHQGGSGVALGKLMVNVASVFMAADDRLLQHLERDSEWLQQQLGTVVPRASAVVPGAADGEPIAIHADHIHMVKFESKTDPGYRTVSGHLRVMAARAGTSIGGRCDTEAKLFLVHSNEPVASFAVQSIVPEVSRVDHFVGRSEELDAIHRELEHDGSRKTAVVHGRGGMVKTQLALAYAQQHKDDYSAVFWVNSKDVDTLKQGYAAAARRVYREHPSLVHLKAVAQGSDLDEAAEALPGHDGPGTFDIRPFLPKADQGAVLITTRSSQLHLGRPVAVKKLRGIEHSLEILSQTSRRERLSLDVDARRLAEELDGLPLAFATAGAYLHLVPDSFAEYLQSYKESWAQLKQDTPQLLSYEDRTLYTTWGISFDHVKKQSSLATKLLQLWAYFDNQDVWLQLLQEARDNAPKWFCELTRDRLVFNKAVRVLCDHALVEADTTLGEGGKESRGYGMHSCGHAWTKHVVNGGWDDGMARLALRCVGLHVPSTDALQYWVTQQRLLRHANQCHSSVNTVLTGREDDITIMDAVHGLGDLYRNQGKLDKAEEM
ncbi:Tetratricopeptide repeat-containing domain protein [Pyrenophora tritici-repentis]|nr:Tetratricopeptide repeat-containing domain protein [Pyrenophora tritici-repentis]